MKVAIAANKLGEDLKKKISTRLQTQGYELSDVSDADIYTATMNVVKAIQEKKADRGIVVDDYAVAPFMIASKNHGIICAPVFEDYTAAMTRRHNSTQMICLAAKVTAEELSCDLALRFLESDYDGGRHQVRIDMLDRML